MRCVKWLRFDSIRWHVPVIHANQKRIEHRTRTMVAKWPSSQGQWNWINSMDSVSCRTNWRLRSLNLITLSVEDWWTTIKFELYMNWWIRKSTSQYGIIIDIWTFDKSTTDLPTRSTNRPNTLIALSAPKSSVWTFLAHQHFNSIGMSTLLYPKMKAIRRRKWWKIYR